MDGDAQFVLGDVDIGGGLKKFLQERAPLVLTASVMRPEKCQQVTLSLKCDHLDEVGDVFAFGGKFDQGAVTEVAHFDPIWERATARDKRGKVVPGSPKFFAEFAMGSLEATHGRALSLRVVYRRRAV